MLTGKCKADFEVWFDRQSYYLSLGQGTLAETGRMPLHTFLLLPPEFQQGVYMAFFKDKGYDFDKVNQAWYVYKAGGDIGDKILGKSKSFNQVLQKANEIYNKEVKND